MKKYWLLLFCLLSFVFPAIAQFSIIESLRGSTLGSNIQMGGEPSAYLTSGIDDPEGDGWLRLTKDVTYQKGYAYIDIPFPSSLGVLIDFEYKTWRSVSDPGGGADGFSVFLFDANSTFRTGGYGGSLGYAPYNGTPGLAGGYIGIGFDEFGNFSSTSDGKVGGPGQRCNSVALRGPTTGNPGTTNAYLTGIQLQTDPNNNTNSIDYNTVTATRPSDDVFYRRVKISIEPVGGNYKITVKWKTTPDGNDITLLTYTMTTPPPANLKIGFAASTGSCVNYHEIRNLVVTTPGGVRVNKIVDKPNAKIGDQLTYKIEAYNLTNSSISHVSLSDTIKDSNNNPIDINSGIYTINSITFNNNGYAGNTASGFPDGVPVTSGFTNPFKISNLSFEANSMSSFIMKVTLNNDVSPGNILKNSVGLDPSLSGITDEDPTNNIFTVSTNVSNTDFKLESSIDKSCVDSINGNTITLLVSNVGTTSSNGIVTLHDTIPRGFTVINVSGVGWDISHSGNIYTFSRSDELSGGSSYPPILLTIKPKEGPPTGNCDPIRTIRFQSYGNRFLTDNGGVPQWTSTSNDNSAWYEIPVEGSSTDFYYKNVGTGKYLYRENTGKVLSSCDWTWEYIKLSATNEETDYYKFRLFNTTTPSWGTRYWIVNIAGANLSDPFHKSAFILSGINETHQACGMPAIPAVVAGGMPDNSNIWTSTAITTVSASVDNPDCQIPSGDITMWINSAKVGYDGDVSGNNNASIDTIYAIPAAPRVVSPITYRQGETASPLTAIGDNLLWYTDPAGPGNSNAPTPQTATVGTTIYYVSQTSGKCESPLSTIRVIVIPQIDAPEVVSPITYCQGDVASPLTAIGDNLLWYTPQQEAQVVPMHLHHKQQQQGQLLTM